MNYSINQLRDFSSLFSRSEVNRWFKEDFQSIDFKLKRYELSEKNKGISYLKILRQTYRLLEKYYPNEYVLKNEFVTQCLKEKIGHEHSVIFNEFRIGKAIADLAMFNGKSTVFEIKTILDKEYRLSNQLKEYKKLFNEIYIIVPFQLLEKYADYDVAVGVISYDSDRKRFSLEHKSAANKKIDANLLMEVLHTKEYLSIVNTYYKDVPKMNSFNQFEICKQLINDIPNEVLNKLFIQIIKTRNIHNSFFNKINREFNQICLSLNLEKNERDELIKKLQTNKV